MYKLSVIVAIYNAEKTLSRCLDSILAQTYEPLEIVLINDGSSDGSDRICLDYQKRFKDKIIYKSQENTGCGFTRDRGIDTATGDYILFVDSDDYIDENMLHECMETINKTDVDMLFFEYEMVTENGEHIKNVKSPYGFDGICNIDSNPKILLLQGMECNKFIKKSIFIDNNITHPKNGWYEDLQATLKVVICSQKVAYTDTPYYKYVINTNSIMRNTNMERNREIFLAVDELTKYFKQKGIYEKFYDELCCIAIDNVYITTTIRLLRMGADSKFIDEFHEYLKKNFPDYKSNKYIKSMSKQYRLTYMLLEMKMRWAVKLLLKIKDR